MVSLQQEEVPLTAEDAELPEMVPVSIRSTLPELQHCPLERVLAGLLLTWKEFLQLFDIRVEASDYFIRGSNGSKSDLNQKIGDYVNTFRRKLKIYPVTLERVAEVSEMSKGQKGTACSEGSNPSKTTTDNNRASGSGSATKKFKLMDEDKRKRNHRKMTKESLEKIAQTVIKEQSTAPKRSGKKGEGKRDINKSGSSTPPSSTATNKADGPSTSSGIISQVTVQQGVMNVQSTSGAKVKRLSTDHSHVKDHPVPSSAGVVKRGRKPRKARTLSSRTLSSSRRSSTKLSINSANNGVESNDEGDSLNSFNDDEEPETRDKNKRLKNNVVKYFQERISPRTLLSLRDELLELREREKYFKVTSIVPMAAGLMEQTFCRKLTE